MNILLIKIRKVCSLIMKTIKEVSILLNVTEMSIKRLIDPSRNHRKILERLGCIVGKEFIFSEDGIKYTAYQYMYKSDECLYYVHPELKPSSLPDDVHEPIEKKVIKNVKVIKKSN